jgi:hypothetical protein
MEIGVGAFHHPSRKAMGDILYAPDFVKPDWGRYKAVYCILERFNKVLLY